MIYFIRCTQTNIINWIFFSINIIMFALIAKADNKKSSYQWSFFFAKCLKVYSAFVLLIDILFLCCVGDTEKFNQPQSYDQMLKLDFPRIYENLDLIGLRAIVNLPNSLTGMPLKQEQEIMKFKFYSYVCYQLVSIYIASYFK